MRLGQHARKHRARAAAEVYCGAAAVRHGIANCLGQIKAAKNLAVQLVPVFRNGVKELAGFKRAFFKNLGGHIEVCPHGGIRVDKGGDGAQKIKLFARARRGIKNPQAITARGEQPGLGKNFEVSRNTRLPHIKDTDQLVDREFVMQQNMNQPQAGFVRQSFEK